MGVAVLREAPGWVKPVKNGEFFPANSTCERARDSRRQGLDCEAKWTSSQATGGTT
ncbi:hypothetical protein A176_003161 [Myxococcus hansupus]|uniref:Uncharacterized protein n=1 Tax=Pseudomyxococcus hansupus TaxID=1297742 RepID=A0A0H4WTW7_9BACT|nr:hypothetical protein A176_003161 [Myxococcus hansupus]